MSTRPKATLTVLLAIAAILITSAIAQPRSRPVKSPGAASPIATPSTPPAATGGRALFASIVSAFDFQGKVRFCYDREPEIIYFRYDQERKLTSLESRSIDGNVRTLFQFAGTGSEPSLSCSQDGSTIAALDGDRQRLFILRASEVSVYSFEKQLLYSVIGKYSLLSPDGSMISVPGNPRHVSGPDVLKQIQLLGPEKSERAFFDDGDAYVDEGRFIDLYRYGDGWTKRRSIAKPPGFYVKEIVRCGSHVVASLSDDYDFRFKTLDEELTDRVDWLSRVGFRRILRGFDDLAAVDGGYGQCVFPLSRKRDVRHVLLGIVVFDDAKSQRFTIGGSPLAMSGHEIHLSKDGCYALLRAFKGVPEIPEFTMRQQAVVLRLAAPGCKT